MGEDMRISGSNYMKPAAILTPPPFDLELLDGNFTNDGIDTSRPNDFYFGLAIFTNPHDDSSLRMFVLNPLKLRVGTKVSPELPEPVESDNPAKLEVKPAKFLMLIHFLLQVIS